MQIYSKKMDNHLSFYVNYRFIGALELKNHANITTYINNVIYISIFRHFFIIVFISLFHLTKK